MVRVYSIMVYLEGQRYYSNMKWKGQKVKEDKDQLDHS